jgi:hypothetical protein
MIDFYDECHNIDVTYYPNGSSLAIGLLKTIDSFHFSGRISPNMHYLFALPRSRRPKPTSHREGRVLFVWMME